MEGLKIGDANLVVYLHPSKSNNVSDAVATQLSSLLFKFNESLDGVLLAYEPDVLGNLGTILPGIHPYFGVKLKSKLLLFNPKPEMLLEGKVVKISQQAIHMIVLGFSSAVIVEEDIREEFRYKIKRGKGSYVSGSQKKHKIKFGTIVRFLVKSFDEEVLHLSGSLLSTNTGSASWLHTNSEDVSQDNSNTKRRKEDEGRDNIVELSKRAISEEAVPLNTNPQTKKSKKRKGNDS
ncbi:Nucleic acid-binding, OB-fold [Heracleum sosnowskyi]|uniref:DNA-directed RNA polymerase subunit n=1 Tax=Heracleum sosnowskyi TaxID=360622 RepID=A0AAD8I0H5_9APIA|nr:Nucleic acid-binding, OB-fold [Heracleum sosnowskyi]